MNDYNNIIMSYRSDANNVNIHKLQINLLVTINR